jgi:hypothetical protein
MGLFRKAGRTRSRARFVCQAEGGNIAPIPTAGLARCSTFLGGLFRGDPWRGIGRRKFRGCERFDLKLSGAYSATRPVIGGPYNLKQLGLLVRQYVYFCFKYLYSNNIAALKSGPRVETAAMFGHIFQESLFVEEMPCSIDPGDFSRDIYG